MNLFKNKKGDERILSFWMFFIWGIIALSIVIGVSLFYGDEADVKILQSEALANRIGSCLVTNNEINKIDNFYEECNLNEDLFSNGKVFFEISYFDENRDIIGEPFILGDKDIRLQCNLRGDQKEKESDGFARCSEKYFYGLEDNKVIKIKIMAGSNNEGGQF